LHNLIRWHVGTLRTGEATLQFAPLSFDASFHEMFAALASGGTLHVAEEAERRDADALVSHLVSARIAKAILPVVVFQQLAALYADRDESFPDLREIAVTGEQLLLTPAILAFCGRRPHIALHNHYGPSEAHVVTAYTFDGPPARLLPPPPIGTPIANTQIYLLDDRLEPVPVGVPAELYIGGANLARGYHARPDLTAEKFVPNPLATRPGERLYRTGDLARYLNDGTIEFLGRIDGQMKIRGHRVEPGEVETALSGHASVAQAAVAVREVIPGSPSLVAYLVPAGASGVDSDALRAFLAATLPDYLIPSHFVALDALPLTPSGKVDRRALPAPARATGDDFVAPLLSGDRWIAGEWASLLGLERVGLRDHFFRLGGHSLLATRLVSRLRQTLGAEIPVRLVFEHPVLAAFGAAVAERAGGRERFDAIAETLLEVAALSDDEAAALLGRLDGAEA
jgi:acyl-coenzyme A synthetase/AMP-(fatty) acid ligase